MYTYIHACIYIYIYILMYINIYILYLHVYTFYIYLYLYTYVYIYTYIHIRRCSVYRFWLKELILGWTGDVVMIFADCTFNFDYSTMDL